MYKYIFGLLVLLVVSGCSNSLSSVFDSSNEVASITIDGDIESNKEDSQLITIDDTGRYRVKDGKIYSHSKILEGEDPDNFYIIKQGITTLGVGQNNFYYSEKVLEGINVGKSNRLYSNGGYLYVDGEIYVLSDGIDKKATLLEDINVSHFSEEYTYIKDDKNVYYKGVIVEGIDGTTFKVLDNPKSNSRNYSIDRNGVYFGPLGNHIVLEGADPKNFKNLGKKYGKDKNSVFSNGIRVSILNQYSYGTKYEKELDAENFKLFGSIEKYGKYSRGTDGNVVVYGDIIMSFDVENFKVLSSDCGRDSEYVYCRNKRYKVGDPLTFEPIYSSKEIDSSSRILFRKDKHLVYDDRFIEPICSDMKDLKTCLKGSTFIYINDYFAKDDSQVIMHYSTVRYTKDNFLSTINAETLVSVGKEIWYLAKDRNNLYYKNYIVEDHPFDLETLEKIEHTKDSKPPFPNFRDKNGTYKGEIKEVYGNSREDVSLEVNIEKL